MNNRGEVEESRHHALTVVISRFEPYHPCHICNHKEKSMSKRKRKQKLSPRNPFVAAAHLRSAGAHGKTEKAKRRNEKMELQRASGRVTRQPAFNRYQVGQNPAAPTKQITFCQSALAIARVHCDKIRSCSSEEEQSLDKR